MSVQAITWALDHRVHSVTEKVILLVLANYANEYGISWPSQRTLAENAACDERTVRRTLVSLEARGVIRRIARRRGNGSRQSDMILMSAFTGRKPAPPGMLDDDEEPGDPGSADEPASLGNRTDCPAANRTLCPHPPGTVPALEPSLILKDSSTGAAPNPSAACLAVAGPGLDRNERGPLTLSLPEIDRWLEAGCDLITDILPVIAAKTAEPRPQPIRSWAYFTPAIIEAKARREAAVAQPRETSNEQGRGGQGKANRRQSAPDDWRDAWDAAVAKADHARAEAAAAAAGGTGGGRPGGGGALHLAFSREAE
jgi:hypothetical protein